MITTKLKLPRRWYELSTPTLATLAILSLVLCAAIVGRVQSLRQQAAAVPTPALAYVYVYPTAHPSPTATAVPTPDERVYQELAALREQVAQLQAAQQAQPQVIYVQPEAPAPAYQVANEQPERAAPTPELPTPELAPQTQAILDRGAWAAMAATARAGR